MCKSIPVLLTVAVLVVLLGYLLYVPLPPEEFEHPIRLTLELAGLQAVDLGGKLGDFFGFGYPTVSRKVTSLLFSLLPVQNDTSVQFFYTNFSGVLVRMYIPLTKERDSRAVVYYHGGGFVLGHIELVHSLLMRTAKTLNVVVASVNYRKAPEHVFPAAVDDSEVATKYFLEHAAEFGVDPNKVAVMGDSAGGNLATVISLRLIRKHFTPLPKLQVLLYPWLQMIDYDLPSYQYNQDGPLITKQQSVDFTTWYAFGSKQYRDQLFNNRHVSVVFRDSVKHIYDRNLLPVDKISEAYIEKAYDEDSSIWQDIQEKFQDSDMSPILAREDEIRNLPPVYISTCQYDIMRDEQLLYVAHLHQAGVTVVHSHLQACFHAWANSHEVSFHKEFTDVLNAIDKLF